MRILNTAALIFISLFLINCEPKEEITLQLNLKKGNTFNMRKEMRANSGELMKFNNLNEIKFRVDSIGSDHQYFMSVKILKIKEDFTMQGERDYYDSSKNPERMSRSEKLSHEENLPYLNAEFKTVIGKHNEVIEDVGTDSYLPIDSQIINLIHTQIPYPDHPIYVGYSWEKDGVNEFLDTKIKHKFTLTKIEEKTVTITVKNEMEGVKGFLKDMTATGTYKIDRQTGLINHGSLEMPLQTGGKANYYFNRF